MDYTVYSQLIAFLNNMPSGCLLISQSSTILFANSSIEALLIYDNDFLIGKPLSLLIPEGTGQRHDNLVAGYFNQLENRQMAKGQTVSILRSDGRAVPVDIYLNPFEFDGESVVLVNIVDLSEKRLVDDILETVITNMPQGVALLDEDGTIVLVNNALCCAFGYTRAEIQQLSIEQLMPARYREHHIDYRKQFSQQPIARMMAPGRDLTALHKDGTEFPVEIGLSQLKSHSNSNLSLVVISDITERKRVELELNEKNRSLEEFTYVASHDLRSPLRGISDLLTWIEEDLDEGEIDEVRKNIERVKVRATRMEKLIENLLNYARAGKANSKIETVDIQALINDVRALTLIPDGFSFDIDVQCDDIKSSRTPLETVIRNLVANAFKHHDKGLGTVTVRCTNHGNMIKIDVSDDGPGIPEISIPRIFQLFQTITSAERSNAGVGLSLSRRLVETHGGKISVANNDSGKGCTFTVLWPRFVRKDTHD